MTIVFLLLGVAVISYVIWISSIGIGRASEMWGCGWSPGVRGATINAIASSLPEFFTAIVFLAVLGDSKGFVSGLSTVAGSSVFNALVIPGAMILAVFFKTKSSLTGHDKKIILRDGIWLVAAQTLIYLFILSGSFSVLHGIVLIIVYALYIFTLFKYNVVSEDIDCYYAPKTRRSLNIQFLAGIIGVGIGCYALVYLCVELGDEFNLNVPVIALLIAAAATSVPDTILSVRDALKENTDDAISNAFGSNIFDLCIALGLPLFIYCFFRGDIVFEPSMVDSLSLLWLVLMGMTVVSLVLICFSKQLKVSQSVVFISIYLGFVFLVVSGIFDLS